MDQNASEHAPNPAKDRRRNVRFGCAGSVRIICLPSDGVLVPGRIRDLSLGGCNVQTELPLECGTLVDILARVNSSSFRAVGCIRMVAARAIAGLQFTRMSHGGEDVLVELLRELARQHAIAKIVRAARDGTPSSPLLQERAAALRAKIPENLVLTVENRTIGPDECRTLTFDPDLDLYI